MLLYCRHHVVVVVVVVGCCCGWLIDWLCQFFCIFSKGIVVFE